MIDIPALVAIVGGLVAALGGITAYRRSGADRDNLIVESAETVVGMLREQVAQIDARLTQVEGTVMSWESWAERILHLLDRAIAMIDADHRATIAAEAEAARQERPDRSPRPLPQPVRTPKKN